MLFRFTYLTFRVGNSYDKRRNFYFVMRSGAKHLDLPRAYKNDILRLSPQDDNSDAILSNESLSH